MLDLPKRRCYYFLQELHRKYFFCAHIKHFSRFLCLFIYIFLIFNIIFSDSKSLISIERIRPFIQHIFQKLYFLLIHPLRKHVYIFINHSFLAVPHNTLLRNFSSFFSPMLNVIPHIGHCLNQIINILGIYRIHALN